MRLLTLCFPTYGQQNPLHLNARGDRIVLAPDEFHRQLLALGWEIDVVSLAEPTRLPLFCSGEQPDFGLPTPLQVSAVRYRLKRLSVHESKITKAAADKVRARFPDDFETD